MLIRSNNKYILTFLYNTPLHELIERSIPGYLTLARVAVIFANGCNRPVKLRYIRAGLETSRGENPQLISAPSPRYLLSPSTVAGRSSFRSRHVNSPAFLIDNRVSQRPFPLTIWWTNGIGNEAASRLRRPPPLFPPRSLSPWTDLSFLVSPSSSFSSCHAEVFYRLRSIGFLASGGDIYIYIKFLIKPQFSSSPLFSNETRFLPLLFFFFRLKIYLRGWIENERRRWRDS